MNILAKRIPSILGMVILIAGLAGGAVLVRQRQLVQPRAAAGGEPIDLAVSNVSDQSFSVSWTTAEAATGRIQMEEKWINDVRDTQSKMTESKTHFVTVGQLEPGTRYEFKVESGGGLYDSRGEPFAVTTAATLAGSLPASDVAQGLVKTSAGEPAGGAIVYAQLPGGQLLAAMTTVSGNWVIPLSTTRIADLSGWLSYDLAATVYTIRAEGGGSGKSTATVTTGIDQPVPPIMLGQSYDFRQGGGEKEEGKRKKEEGAAVTPVELESSLRSLFNFEDLGPVTPVAADVTLLNPGEEGEKISTTKPKFFGEGPRDTQVNITIESPQTINGNAVVGDDGKWSFAAPADLAAGKHKVTLKWTDEAGILQTLTRTFVVQAASGEPAFTASPSAVPTKKLTPTLSAKKTVPATSSGTPKSGGLTPSVMLVMMGILLISGGGLLLKSEIRNPKSETNSKF